MREPTWDSAGIGTRIKEARTRRGLSQQVLGELAGHSQGWLSKLEAGRAVPKIGVETLAHLSLALNVPVPDLLGEVAEPLGEITPVPALIGLEQSWTAGGALSALRTVTEDGEDDMRRRGFLALTGSAAFGPALGWLGATSPAAVAAERGGGRLTEAGVADLARIAAHLARTDEHLDRGVVLAMVQAQLAQVKTLLNDRSYTESVGRQAYAVAAELLRLSSRINQEMGRAGAAQRYAAAALKAANAAGDRALGANIMSYQADIAWDSGRYPESLRMASIAVDGYTGDTPAVTARVRIQSALARSSLGDAKGALADLDVAFAAIERPGERPDWAHWVDPAMVHQFAGSAALHTGDWDRAEEHYQTAAELPGSWVREAPAELGRVRVRLAEVAVRGRRDPVRAVQLGTEALGLFSASGNTPPMSVLRNMAELRKELAPYADSTPVADFLDQLRAVRAAA